MIALPATATMAAMAVLWTLLSNTLRRTEVLTPKRAIPTKAWMILAGIVLVCKNIWRCSGILFKDLVALDSILTTR